MLRFFLIWAIFGWFTFSHVKRWLDREPYWEALSGRAALAIALITAIISFFITWGSYACFTE
jgi:hypothetical protein